MVSAKILLCLLVAIGLALAGAQEVDTTNGWVKGKSINVLGKSLDVFHGIPFAKPPVGDLRFKHPQAIESWRPNVKDATVERPSCMQSLQNYGEDFQTPNDLSEDCLYLSIWKPSSTNNGSNLAVMVWIYGGSFSTGSTRVPLYNGQYLAAENDVIVVSINYRLGALGFSFLGPDTIPGNMGLMDQVEGLKWIKNNIQIFGGDKTRITLFGESAGAFSIGYHLLSPLTQDLFNNGILQSGSPIHSVTNGLVLKPTEARNNVKKLSQVMICSGSSDAAIYECLKAADPQTIITATATLSVTGVNMYPVEDGYYLPSNPSSMTERGKHKKTDILIGVTKDEITFFLSGMVNPLDGTFTLTGEKFNYQSFQLVVDEIIDINDTNVKKALKRFYDSGQNPPVDYLELLNHLGTDFGFKCPALLFSSLYTESNNVYMYSLNHRISTIPVPDWMGVPHAFDIPYVFGRPLKDSVGSTEEEKELSRNIMRYWSNFAKSGDPNSPVSVTANWPVFNKENQTYMALDVGSNLATKHGFRRLQCAFVNDILPMIRKPSTMPPIICPTSGRGFISGSVYVVLGLLTVSIWMRRL